MGAFGLGLGLGFGSRRGGALAVPADLAVFADGTDGFLFRASQLDTTYVESTGVTPAITAGQSIGLALDVHSWQGRTLTQELAGQAELVVNGDLLNGPTGFSTLAGATLAVVGGQLEVTGNGGSFPAATQSIATVSGQSYQLTAKMRKGTASTASIYISPRAGLDYTTTSTSEISISRVFAAVSATTTIALGLYGSRATGTAYFDDISVKLIPGNAGSQATSGARPTRQAGNLVGFDGLDDAWQTPLIPGTAATIMARMSVTKSGQQAIIGARAAVGLNSYLSADSSGRLSGGAGGQALDTIFGGSSIIGAGYVVGAITYNASAVNLYLDGVLIYTGAFSGAANTLWPLAIGGYNSAGTLQLFSGCDMTDCLVAKKALTASEIQAITNQWGTT